MDKLSYIKQRFEGNFDVKYREVKTIIGDGTLVFIDDLCNGQWMMEYLILPLRGFGELKDSSIKTPNDLLEKVFICTTFIMIVFPYYFYLYFTEMGEEMDYKKEYEKWCESTEFDEETTQKNNPFTILAKIKK